MKIRDMIFEAILCVMRVGRIGDSRMISLFTRMSSHRCSAGELEDAQTQLVEFWASPCPFTASHGAIEM